LVAAQLQNQDGESEAEDQLDWDALARFPGTLVLYMSIGSAPAWSQKLIAAGKPASTPVALVRKCSWPDQEVLECELETVGQTLLQNPGFAPPAISIIGPLVRYKASMAMKISQHATEVIVTSPEAQSRRLASMLDLLGVSVLVRPALTIEQGSLEQIDAAIDAMQRTDWVVFSSRYGVEHFFNRLLARGLDARRFGSTRIATVGRSTAQALAEHGLKADCIASGNQVAKQSAEGLLGSWLALAQDQRVTVVRTPEGKRTIEEQLTGVAREIRIVDAYEQVPVEQWSELEHLGDKIQSGKDRSSRLLVTATSSNIAKSAWRLLGEHSRSVGWVAISESVAGVLKGLGATDILVAKDASYESICEAILADQDARLRHG